MLEEDSQRFRLAGTTEVLRITCCRFQGREVILWEEIQLLFPGVLNVRRGNILVPPLRDGNLLQMNPRCIAYSPRDVLEVHLSRPAGLGLDMSPPVVVQDVASTSLPFSSSSSSSSSSAPQVRNEADHHDYSDAVPAATQRDPPLRPDTRGTQELSPTTTTPHASEHHNISSATTSGHQAVSKASAAIAAPYLTEARATTTVTTLTPNSPHAIPTTPYTCFGPLKITTVTITSTSGSPHAIIPETTTSTSGPQRITTATILFAEGSKTISPENLDGFIAEVTTESASSYPLQLSAALTDAAKKGDSEAQCNLGFTYMKGQEYGVLQNFELAFEWFVKAAKSGSFHAACNLGVMFQNGIGVQRDYQKAMSWYLTVANPGLFDQWFFKPKPAAPAMARAELHIGMLHYFGHGVAKDFQKAAEWFQKAANHGNAEAQNALGFLYSVGEGVPLDYKIAIQWYLKAAAQENAHAQSNMGALYAVGNGVVQDDCEAVDWFSKAAVQGVVTAQSNLGSLYAREMSVLKDYSKAVEWFTKGANNNDAFSQRELGVLYSKGAGVPQDHLKALELYTKSANQGYADAQSDLGFVYANGLGISRDDVLASQWHLKAAKQGHTAALSELALMYDAGRASLPRGYTFDTVRKALEKTTRTTNRRNSAWLRAGKGKGEGEQPRLTDPDLIRTIQGGNLNPKSTFNFSP